MRFLSLLPLALGVSSLLIPPQVNENTYQISELPRLKSIDKISLKCVNGCPVVKDGSVKNRNSRGRNKMWVDKLRVDVVVNRGKVLFNGQQIWPRTTLPPTLSVKQRWGGQSVPISTVLDYKPETLLINNRRTMKIHPVSIEIMAVGDEVVQVESVVLNIAESTNGVGLAPSVVQPYHSSPLIDSCTNIWCRVRGTIIIKYNEWRKVVANKFRGLRNSCGRKAGHKVTGVKTIGGPNKFATGATFGSQGHHHRRGGFFRHLKRAFKAAIVPTVLGLGIGLTVGSIMKAIIIRIQRRRAAAHGEYIEVKQSEIEDGRTSIDGPPKYEEVYSEEQVEEENEKK